ncbi:MAG TPA: O-antigen ligase family protein, partial [Verrucomicrobiae bacterium]|nr:O-antigen ligase family protein [Verrucomicrobiae bacterium]
WVASTTKSFILRIIMLGAFGYGLYVILASGSRGALIAVGVAAIYYLFSASNKQRIAALSIGTAMLAIAFSLVSDEAIHRLFSFSETTSSQSSGATQSEESRTQLLEDSIMFALKNPLFGVGPGDFSVAEGESRKGFWLEPHNSYTEAACECGIPAFIFLVAGLVSSFGILRRIGREWGKDVRAKEFTQAAFFLRLSVVAFCSAIFFLNFAYLFHLPMIGGISIAMGHASEDWKSRQQPAEPAQGIQTSRGSSKGSSHANGNQISSPLALSQTKKIRRPD